MDVTELLSAKGSLAQYVRGFAPRPQQQAMAKAVASALLHNKRLVVEAGTGIGKTYAYLVPALLSGKKIIISTGTRNLQEQLYYRDIPTVCKALGLVSKAAIIKGRSNYLCVQRLTLAETRLSWLGSQQATELVKIQAWAQHTRVGDIAEVKDVAEDSSVWSQVTSTVDNCWGQQCPHFQDCYLVKARRKAFEANLLVVNHHLLCADMVLKEDNLGELLPDADAFVLDEAHQLPEIASYFFGLSLSSRQLTELAKDTVAEQLRNAPDFEVLAEYVRHFEKAITSLRFALGKEPQRTSWYRVMQRPQVRDAGEALRKALHALQRALKEAAMRGKGLENCYKRSKNLAERLALLLTRELEEDGIHWFETRTHSFTVNFTPLEIAPSFSHCLNNYPDAWIFTSATLTVADSFEHFNSRLGLGKPETLCLDSPFDFSQHAMLYHPHGLPEPASPYYTKALVDAALPVLQASRARAFLLFTSYRALREAAAALRGRLDYPILLQGSLPKSELLSRFQSLGNAVLLGTASFWEGVDVRGDALSCVVIDKLPFASPGDPVLKGRIEAMRRRGEDPFIKYQLPHAVLTLKQGVGRLIRDVHDRGVLMLGDPRLFSKSYGQVFLASLPPMARTHELDQVRLFFALQDDLPLPALANNSHCEEAAD